MNTKTKTESALEMGFKYQIGFFSVNGNYTRLGFLKTNRQSQIGTYSKKYNVSPDRIQIQVLQTNL